LSERFRLLTAGSRTAFPRHRTLRALFDWSHDLLSEQAQVVFRRLAVFAGGWTLEAAEAVCGDTEDAVLDLLTDLVDKSLALAVESAGEARFVLLETIREYALERLAASGDASVVGRRHASWYLSLAVTAKPSLMSDENLRAWLTCLDQERDNLRAALRWLRESRDVEGALRLVGALWLFWQVRDDLAEGRAEIDAVLALPGASTYPAALAEARQGAGQIALSLGDLPTARSHLEWVVDYHRGSADHGGLGWALVWLGAVARHQGEFPRAASALHEALAVGRDVADRRVTGWALYGLGITTRLQGNPIGARPLLEESLAVFRRAGWTEHVTAQVIGSLGSVAEDLGDDAEAAARFREALRVLGSAEDRHEIAGLLERFASLATKASQPARALRLIGAAARLREEIGSPVALIMRGPYDRTLDLARAQFAPDVADAELAAGRKMNVRESVAYALDDKSLDDELAFRPGRLDERGSGTPAGRDR
jgi:tetratricopeptide (TPR) repeat protein